jgi:hypothetical protein
MGGRKGRRQGGKKVGRKERDKEQRKERREGDREQCSWLQYGAGRGGVSKLHALGVFTPIPV